MILSELVSPVLLLREGEDDLGLTRSGSGVRSEEADETDRGTVEDLRVEDVWVVYEEMAWTSSTFFLPTEEEDPLCFCFCLLKSFMLDDVGC